MVPHGAVPFVVPRLQLLGRGAYGEVTLVEAVTHREGHLTGGLKVDGGFMVVKTG